MPLDLTGFELLTLNTIIAEIETAFKDAYGQGIDLNPDSNFGKTIGIMAEREFLLREDDQAVYDAAKITASGVSLDDVVALVGLTRKTATKSTAVIYAAGNIGTIISANSLFAVQDTNEQFTNLASATIAGAGTLSVVSITHVAGLATLTSAAPHGVNAGEYVFVFNADQTEYNGLQLVTDAPTATTLEFLVDAGAITPATGTITMQTTTAIAVESLNTGEVVSTAGTLTEIVNFISGLDLIENGLDASLGEPDETDSELRTRRAESLSIAGGSTPAALLAALLQLEDVTATRIVENVLDFPDGQGRPAHSFESVVQGGLDSAIAQIVFDNKPAGIETFGSVTVPVIDINGDPFNINFSRPTPISIWLETDITTEIDFPVDGIQQVEDAIIAYGQTLTIGNDVIVFGSNSVINAIGSIPGISDIVVRIGIAVSPTLDDNVLILPNELALFDSTRITIAVI